MKCPICGFKETKDLIVDLSVCNWCNHVFKKNPLIEDKDTDITFEQIPDPIKEIRATMEEQPELTKFDFDFQSLMFETFDLYPKDFYNYKINHYFNQMSLMVFLKRCELIPLEQTNYIDKGVCRTHIICRRMTTEEGEDASNMYIETK